MSIDLNINNMTKRMTLDKDKDSMYVCMRRTCVCMNVYIEKYEKNHDFD